MNPFFPSQHQNPNALGVAPGLGLSIRTEERQSQRHLTSLIWIITLKNTILNVFTLGPFFFSFPFQAFP